ncbi:MAG TPA: type II toxin-antitoxin system prevent-host-death family antitoxin [bacterium]|nr:type II toxin-antitoxin system prevent-host-death family antitoxin [bacterium]
MKFVPLREFRNHPQAVLKKLKAEKEIILTSHGKPVARIGDLAEETFEEDLYRHRKKQGLSTVLQATEATAPYQTEDLEVLQAWIQEAERRREEYVTGKTKLIPANQVFAKLRRKFK